MGLKRKAKKKHKRKKKGKERKKGIVVLLDDIERVVGTVLGQYVGSLFIQIEKVQDD